MSSRLNRKIHDAAKVPVLNKPRSVFKLEDENTTTMDVGKLIPFFKKEVNPGDTFNGNCTFFGRLSTQVAPIMDDLWVKTYFFFVPYRIIWDNFVKMHGERINPDDSIDYLVPQVQAPEGGFGYETIYDYLDVPPNISGLKVNALPFRAYNMIYNEYFRDENLIDSLKVNKTDSGDLYTDFSVQKKAKIHDYFTSCLPYPQKGEGVTLPLGTEAPVIGNGKALGLWDGGANTQYLSGHTVPNAYTALEATLTAATPPAAGDAAGAAGASQTFYGITKKEDESGIIANLRKATAATIDGLNTAIRLQTLLQLDARCGTRYEEMLQAHFSVTNPDARLQKPELLGASTTRVSINGVLQTSQTTDSSVLGELAGHGIVGGSHKAYNKSFTEYGIILGIAAVCSKPAYQQGLERIWTRRNRYDFFYPIFNGLPEQEVLNKEIYCQGTDDDEEVFGYQERYAEYKYGKRSITGKMRSSYSDSLDHWHLAQQFTELPQLNQEFIEEDIDIQRTLAVTNEPALLMDFKVDTLAYREMPVYNIPTIGGLMR